MCDGQFFVDIAGQECKAACPQQSITKENLCLLECPVDYAYNEQENAC